MLKNLLVALLATTSLAIASDETQSSMPMDDNGDSVSGMSDMQNKSDMMMDKSMSKDMSADEPMMGSDPLKDDMGMDSVLDKKMMDPDSLKDDTDMGTGSKNNAMNDMPMNGDMGDGDMIDSAPGSSMGGDNAAGMPAGVGSAS